MYHSTKLGESQKKNSECRAQKKRSTASRSKKPSSGLQPCRAVRAKRSRASVIVKMPSSLHSIRQ